MHFQWFPFRILHPQIFQGSILGPLFFLLYINDLPNCLSYSEPRMYVDDTHLTYWSGNIHFIQSSLNEDLLNISLWLTANKLTLNMTKTEFMLIGWRRQKLDNLPSLPSLNVNNIPIKHSQCFKSFGVLIDKNLTWENHDDALSKEIAYLRNQDCKLHKWTACAVHLPDLWINKFWPLRYSFATHLINPVYHDCSMKKQPISTAVVLEFRELL